MRNRLLQLLAQNRKPFEPVQSKIVQEDGQAALYLYDPIVGDRVTAEWWGGVCPQDLVPALRALKADEITVYTNCPGGDVFAAEAISQAFREHPAQITMQIEGYAASAATSLACACDRVVATAGSKYMIHNTWTLAIGNADDLEKTVALLRNCDNSMYDRYVGRTGQPRDQIVEWCNQETWFNADAALAAGFIDEVLPAVKASAKVGRDWVLSAYHNAPAPVAGANPAPQEPAEPTEQTIYLPEEHRVRQLQRLALHSRL